MLLFSLLLLLHLPAPTITIPVAAPLPPALYLSTDRGESWDGFSAGLPEDVQPREVLEHNGNLYLTALDYGLFVLPAGDCVWQHRNTGLPRDDKFAFFPTSIAAHGNTLLLGTFTNGIYLSKDGGAHWHRPVFNVSDVVGSLLFTDNLLLAGTHNGIWQSFDRGESWQLLRPDKNVRTNAIALHGGKIFVAKQNGMGILTGRTVHWSDLVSRWAVIQLLRQGDYLYAVSAKNEIYRTTDGTVWEAPTDFGSCLPADNLAAA
ncbi:MAG: sialidase family protein, partial [Saprospiraceae bacterium]